MKVVLSLLLVYTGFLAIQFIGLGLIFLCDLITGFLARNVYWAPSSNHEVKFGPLPKPTRSWQAPPFARPKKRAGR